MKHERCEYRFYFISKLEMCVCKMDSQNVLGSPPLQYWTNDHILKVSCAWMHYKGSLKKAKTFLHSKVSVVTCIWPLDNLKWKSKKDTNSSHLIMTRTQINCLGHLMSETVQRSPLNQWLGALKFLHHSIKHVSRVKVFKLTTIMLNMWYKRTFSTAWDHIFNDACTWFRL